MKVNTGMPTEQGTYIAYTEVSKGFPYPDKTMLMWTSEGWGYQHSDQNFRGVVFGWIGPLPCPKIDEM